MRSLAAHVMLTVAYGLTLFASAVGRLIPRPRWKPTRRIAVTGTFHNPGWYLSHITPLARSWVEEVILIVDEPQAPIEKVRFVCPPRWVAKLLGRAVAKALWMIVAGVRFRPDLYMGYHILPGACSALIAGRLFGRPACYQMTGGPIEIIGGGSECDTWVGNGLARPSAFLERLAMAVARQFDLIVVRGTKAKAFFVERGVNGTVTIITGSVNPRPPETGIDRPFDLAFVGRLTEIKQPGQFVEVVAMLHRSVPSLRAIVLGEGPLGAALKEKAAELQVADAVDFLGKRKDVDALVAACKVFVLTSRSEGLSIAMAEAMAVGTVPVVANVGELSDLVSDGVNGFLVEPNNIAHYVDRISTLLCNHDLWARCSQAAAQAAARSCGVDTVSNQWRICLQEVTNRALGAVTE